MKHLRLFALVLMLASPMPMVSACTTPVTVVTPEGKAAFTANEVLIRVERLQDAVIAASINGSLPKATAQQIVFVTVNLAEIADSATQGWQATARQSWTQAKAELAALRPGGQFALLAATIDELLGGN